MTEDMPAANSTPRITLQVHGETFEFDMPPEAENILDVALDAGIDLPSSCRAGSCATCRARVIEGGVTMANNMVLDDEDLEAGYILACQALPTTPFVSLDFDCD